MNNRKIFSNNNNCNDQTSSTSLSSSQQHLLLINDDETSLTGTGAANGASMLNDQVIQLQEESYNDFLHIKKEKIPLKNVSFIGLFTCTATLVLAFMFKDQLINLLMYLERTSTQNVLEFHLILILLFIAVSLPILWGYLICILICSYVYSYVYGFLLVAAYSAIGTSCSFFICRFVFYDFANRRVKRIAYLNAICSIIRSNEKGFYVIFLSRLMPIPFGLANALFAVTDVQFSRYMLASIIGLIPTQVIICYMGSTLKSMSDVLANESTAKTATFVFFVQLVIAIGVMFYLLQTARIELNKHIIKSNLNNNSSSNNLLLAAASNIHHENNKSGSSVMILNSSTSSSSSSSSTISSSSTSTLANNNNNNSNSIDLNNVSLNLMGSISSSINSNSKKLNENESISLIKNEYI